MTPPSFPPPDSAATLSLIESRFRGAIAASLDAFFLCESVRDVQGAIVDFRIVELNDRAEALLGRSRDALLGHLVSGLVPSSAAACAIAQCAEVVDNGESLDDELEIESDEHGSRWIRYQVVRVENGVAVTSRDITERRQVEATLRDSEARFRQLVESASDGIYRIDPHGVFTYANPIASRLLGLDADEQGIVGRLYLEFVRPDYHEQGIALYKKQVADRIPVTYWEFPALTTDGRQLWIGQNVHVEQRNGAVTSLFAVARDITERKIAELALRESEERHRFLSENSTDMLSRQAPTGEILYVSPVSLKLLGYDAADLIETSIFEYCHPDDLEALRAANARLLGHDRIETLTYRIRRRDGKYVWFETTSQAVRDSKTGLVAEVLSVSRDVTERRRLEEELRHAHKMEAIGQLAGGVAHDFNNLLTSIRGFADLLARGVAPDDPRRADIAQILGATERAAGLTRQLLTFGKRQVLRLETLNLNGVVEDMTRIVRRLLNDGMLVETALSPDVWNVRADPAHLEQVLLNLALNARDAMPDGGKLRIATRNLDVPPHAPTDSTLSPGKYVMLQVSDTGVGMTDDVRARVFEPFFTTKDPREHSGLGLASVYGIIQQTGGHISAASRAGEGATFTIHLPIATAAPVKRAPLGTTPRSSKRNVILLAEDNEGVRALTVRLLADAGYTVLEGCDGVDALDTLREQPEPVDLLISDVLMPRMNGSELAANFQRIQPGTPILLISGYMDEDAVRRSFDDPDAILAKPFAAEALLSRVASLIGSPRK